VTFGAIAILPLRMVPVFALPPDTFAFPLFFAAPCAILLFVGSQEVYMQEIGKFTVKTRRSEFRHVINLSTS